MTPETAPREIAYPPVEIALLDWWRGVYDHVFVALHPLHRVAIDGSGEDDLDAMKTSRPVAWDELRRATGDRPFPDFALALWCVALLARREDADLALADWIERTVAANRLALPWEDTVPPILERPLGVAFGRLGVASVTAWDEEREVSTEIAVDALVSPAAIASQLPFFGPFALHAPGMLATAGTEDIATLIALTPETREIVRPEEQFEGFYADAATYCDWMNPKDFFDRLPPGSG